jgi:hypothetical protein
MSLSYHPLCVADMSVRAIAVHQGLALPVLLVPLSHDSEFVTRLVAAEPVPSFRILNQPIDPAECTAPWSDRSRGPGWASSPASTLACKKELHLHVKVKNQ